MCVVLKFISTEAKILNAAENGAAKSISTAAPAAATLAPCLNKPCR